MFTKLVAALLLVLAESTLRFYKPIKWQQIVMDTSKVSRPLYANNNEVPDYNNTHQIKRKKMSKVPVEPPIPITDAIPTAFDSTTKWPKCKSIARAYLDMKEECYSAWASIAAWVLTDKFCIQSEGKEEFVFSGTDILNCCTECMRDDIHGGCYGGDPYMALEHCVTTGVVSGGETNSSSCKPFTVNEWNHKYKCSLKCSPNYNGITYAEDQRFAKKVRRINASDPAQVQLEVMNNGPVMAVMLMLQRVQLPNDKQKVVGVRTASKIIGWEVVNETAMWVTAFTTHYQLGAAAGLTVVHIPMDYVFLTSEGYIFSVEMDIAKRNPLNLTTFSGGEVKTSLWVYLPYLGVASGLYKMMSSMAQ